jgi:hypothetical protein
MLHQKKNVLIISPEPWDHIKVSKHNYAIELSKMGYKVFFLNPPDSINKKINLQKTLIENIYIFNYAGQIRGLRYFPSFIRLTINRIFLKKLELVAKVRIDIVWNFENSRLYDMRFANNRLKIYHQVDLNQDFHVRAAASSADICFCTTDYIKQKIIQYNKNSFKIHHGVSDESFLENSYPSTNIHPVATLVGNLDISYFDLDLFEKLVLRYEYVHFNLIGTYLQQGLTYKKLSKYQNVQFIGKVESSLIKEYLAKSDILLVCYKANEFKEQLASPHKMMEYLASGKVILTTYADEYKDKCNLLLMANSSVDYLMHFDDAVSKIDFYNSRDKMNERILYAKENTYARQLERINDALCMLKLPNII